MSHATDLEVAELERRFPAFQCWVTRWTLPDPISGGFRHWTLFHARRWDGTGQPVSADSAAELAGKLEAAGS